MTITPIGGGVDVPAYVADTAGNKQNAIVVVPVNADGTPATGGSGSSPSIAGFEYNSTAPTLVNGQTDALQSDSRGNLKVTLISSDSTTTSTVRPSSTADNIAGAGGLSVWGQGLVYSDASSTWYRMRGDTTGTYMILKGSGTLATNQATVTTSATQIIAARTGRSRVTITNLGTTDVFIGPTGVTATTGQILVGTKGASITLNTSAAIFAIVGTGTQAVSFIEEY